MPPTYRQVAPKQSKSSFHMGPPPPSHQPATQLDQTVGTFEARPRTSSVCHWPRPFVLESDMREQEIRPSGKCKNKGVTQQALGASQFLDGSKSPTWGKSWFQRPLR